MILALFVDNVAVVVRRGVECNSSSMRAYVPV